MWPLDYFSSTVKSLLFPFQITVLKFDFAPSRKKNASVIISKHDQEKMRDIKRGNLSYRLYFSAPVSEKPHQALENSQSCDAEFADVAGQRKRLSTHFYILRKYPCDAYGCIFRFADNSYMGFILSSIGTKSRHPKNWIENFVSRVCSFDITAPFSSFVDYFLILVSCHLSLFTVRVSAETL